MNSVPEVILLPGDGIGPEVTAAAVRVVESAGFEARWTEMPIGWRIWREEGDALPSETLDAVRRARVALFGAITSKADDQAQAELAPHLRNCGLRYRSPIVRLRTELDLFATERPAKGRGVNLVTIRESTEGLYAGIETGPVEPTDARHHPDLAAFTARGRIATSTRVVTEAACERIARIAFQRAEARRETRVVLADKPNVLRVTGGLFMDAARRVGADFPGIELAIENVDATCMRLAMAPGAYGVILAGNLFGDIISDLAAGLTGGPGLAASASVGERCAVFEPVHGSAPDIAGAGRANPIAAIRAGAMLADHVGRTRIARRIEAAIERVLAEGSVLTPDLGGSATTDETTDAVIAALESADAPPAPEIETGDRTT